MPPLISVVVPTLNQGAYIEQTLASLFGQNYPRLEVIVIDGGSTDATAEIVSRYPVTHFVSERDSGQAEAINKGFRLARGDILAWLNSDDYYLPLTLDRIVSALGAIEQPRLVYGNCLLWHEQEHRAEEARLRPFDRERLRTSCYIIQPSAFWTRSLWEKTGPLNEEYHFVLDWDWWLRASANGEFTHLDQLLSVYRFHPQHKTGSGSPRRAQEIVALIERTASPAWVAAFRDVSKHLDSMSRSWVRFGATGRYRWHKLRHWPLYLRHGSKADEAFWQLHG